MKTVKVTAEWADDGTVSVMMEGEMFSGMGATVAEALAELREGVAFYIETAKEMGFPYKEYLDGDFEMEVEYDAVSMLQYARQYLKETKLAEMTGIAPQQLGRYANGKSRPRAAQQSRIVEALRRFAASLS